MKKILGILTLAIVACVFACCSKDDEPQDYTDTYDGVAVYINVTNTLYNSDGKPAFTPTGTDGLYIAAAESREVALDYVASLILNEKWNRDNVTVKLGENGENGSLKVVTRNLEPGVYCELIADIKGDEENYPPFTLLIEDMEKANEDNGVSHEVIIVIKR